MSKKIPGIEALVVNAIRNLQAGQGSTTKEITSYLTKQCDLAGPDFKRAVQLTLKRGVNYGILQRSKRGFITCDRNIPEPIDLYQMPECASCARPTIMTARKGGRRGGRGRKRGSRRSRRGRSRKRKRGGMGRKRTAKSTTSHAIGMRTRSVRTRVARKAALSSSAAAKAARIADKARREKSRKARENADIKDECES